MNNQEKRFVEFVRSECKKHNIKLVLKSVKFLRIPDSEGGIDTCSGYFDSEGGVLACSTKRDGWLGVLAHEYCHLTQYVENNKEWAKAEKLNSYEAIHDWLSGKPVRNIKTHLGAARDLELDNEKRTVEVIKRFKLNINLEDYVRKSNAYVQFYNYMYYSRCWCTPKNSPYIVKDIYENLPSKFNMKYKSMSNRVKKLYDKVYKP